MDIVSIGFILIMVLVGGFVAWFADNLGRTLGKKRLTLFGMRPRHTATLLTVLAGMFIPLLTVFAVAGASSDVRQWIAEGRMAIRQRDEAVRDRDNAQKEVASLSSQRESLLAVERELRENLSARRTELANLNKEVKKLNEQAGKSRAEISRLLTSVKRTGEELRTTRFQLEDSKQDLSRVTAERNRVQGNLSTLTTSYQKLDTEFEALQNNFKTLNNLKQEYEQEWRRLDNENKDLEKQNTSIKADLDRGRQELDAERASLEQARNDITSARMLLEDLQAGVAALQNFLGNTRTDPLMFAIGQEIARVSVPQGVDEVGSKAYLQALLKKAAEVSERAGATPLPSGTEAAGLVERQSDTGERVSVQEQEQRFTSSIQREKTEVVLVARSLVNSFKGEFVGLDVRIFRNPVVYRAGQVISDGRINGNESEISIYSQVVTFLQTTLREKAMRDGMIPVAGGQVSLGEVSSETMFQLMREIKGFGRPVRLIAMAEDNTRAGDPLKLQFRLR